MKLKVKILHPKGKLPTRGNPKDAGLDLYWNGEFTKPLGYAPHVAFDTGISIEVPEGYVGLIWPRSGLSYKQGVDVLAGVIDHGYTGEVKVILNHFPEIKEGDRIAQLLIQPITMLEVEEVNATSNTVRGDKGFGSTGA